MMASSFVPRGRVSPLTRTSHSGLHTLVMGSRLFYLLLLLAIAPLASATEVPLVKTGGVYAVPARSMARSR